MTETPSLLPNTTQPRPEADPRGPLGSLQKSRNCAAFMLAEFLIAAAVLGLIVVASTQALLISNRLAASSRVLTGARAVLQRNIDTALTTTFTQSSEPAILAVTAGPQVWDDDGGADNSVQIAVQDNNGIILAKGVLTRNVVKLANSDNADIRQVTFSLNYTYLGRNLTMAMSTIRSRDD